MKNTFEPFKNNRKSHHPNYQPGGKYYYMPKEHRILCKNCKKSYGSHCGIFCPDEKGF